MTANARLRFALIAVALAAAYYYLLIYIVGWVSAHDRPVWWVGVFPSRRIGALAWLIALHTFAVLSAAFPVALAAVLLARKIAVQLGLLAAAMTTVVAVVPSLISSVWPLIWNSHPVFFVTDQLKIIMAVPFIAWVIRSTSSRTRLERSQPSIAQRLH